MSQLAITEAGPEPDPTRAQWFTAPVLAQALVDLARPLLDDARERCFALRVLEPSAGSGALIRAILARAPGAFVDAVELDGRWYPELASIGGGVSAIHADYLSRHAPTRRYDLTVMNPPYDGGEEAAHVAKALDESERVLALLPARPRNPRPTRAHVWVLAKTPCGELASSCRVCGMRRSWPGAERPCEGYAHPPGEGSRRAG